MIITLADNQKDCRLQCNLGACFTQLSSMPGRKRWQDRDLIFSPTGANIAFILERFPEADWRAGAGLLRDQYICLKQQEDNIRQEKLETLAQTDDYQFKTVPFRHQLQAFLLSRELRTFALFHEQGCGKTKVIIDTAAWLFEKGEIDTLIVVAPNGVHRNWIVNELPAHLPDRVPRWMGFYSASLPPKQLRLLTTEAAGRRDRLRIIAFNVEGFVSAKATELFETWLRASRSLLVVDESSRIKNSSAQRTKYIVKAGLQADYRRIMTGTPVTKGVENLYSQFLFLDHRILGYNSFYTFRSAFCVMGGFESKQIVAYKHVDELVRVIDGHSHRVLKKDCLDLPPKIYKRMPFEMTPHQRKLYDAIRTGALEELERILGEEEGRKRAAELAITTLIRLQQVASGWLPQETPEPIAGPNPRMDSLESVLDDAEGKAIIWARFKADLRSIYVRLGDKAVRYWGEVPERERAKAIEQFQDPHSKVRYFVGHPRAAGIGLTLTAAESAIYYSNDFDLELRLQSEDRCHRIGTTKHVVYVDLEAARSIDGKIISALRRKKALADTITQDPASIFLED